MISLLVRTRGKILTLSKPHHQPKRGHEMGDLDILNGGYIGAEEGKITFVSESPPPPSMVLANAVEIDCEDKVILPAFVDCHSHLIWAGTRVDEFYQRCQGATYQEIARSGGGIKRTALNTRLAPDEILLSKARRNLAELLKNGVTATEGKSGYALELDGEIRLLELLKELKNDSKLRIVPTFLVHGIPEEYRSSRESFIVEVKRKLIEIRNQALADFVDVFVDQTAIHKDEAKELLLSAKELGFRLRIHADQFSDDSSSMLAVELGVACVDHLEFASDEAIKALSASDTACVLLPGASFFSGAKVYAPARKFIDAGAIVALATDLNPGSSHIFSPAFIITLASLELGMSAEECITAFTKNSAYALGLPYEKGAISPGMDADLLVLATDDYRDLGYMVGAVIVDTVIARGEILLEKGVLVSEPALTRQRLA